MTKILTMNRIHPIKTICEYNTHMYHISHDSIADYIIHANKALLLVNINLATNQKTETWLNQSQFAQNRKESFYPPFLFCKSIKVWWLINSDILTGILESRSILTWWIAWSWLHMYRSEHLLQIWSYQNLIWLLI